MMGILNYFAKKTAASKVRHVATGFYQSIQSKFPISPERKFASTMKQKTALQNMVENGGNVSKAMIYAGYSLATAKTPQKLTESKGFKALLEEERTYG